ncbi:outer membrane protein assembly factor BamE [Rhabdonatronobacter sediminivivens]|nr:outer membrane protein assembly factor BamE [Rhabdonatronobacter sediminivivens]
MTKLTHLTRGRVFPILALVLIMGCAPQPSFHGFVPSEAALAEVEVGRDTRDTVAEKLGRPGAAGLMEGAGWYYVQSDWVRRGWSAPVEIDRQVVAISFDSADRVSNIERFGIDDGQVVALSRRVTDTGPTGGSLLRRLFGNLGRFAPGLIDGG